MRKRILLLSLLMVTSRAAWGDASTSVAVNSKRVIQDPKTRVIYYLESDLRHIAALDPHGTLLWCCEVIPLTMEPRVRILSFAFSDKNENQIFATYAKDKDLINVTSNPIGPCYGVIDKKTGVYTVLGSD